MYKSSLYGLFIIQKKARHYHFLLLVTLYFEDIKTSF